ncbi:TonB-dependent siderophore receptor [Ideonella dechloratans]|uniref:TonB-dependent siderophore receptor n=1 Tax=Ideonella dechloratans TaxID=36863 RepID=A0A643FHE0_IDEDE|nr:TonB-dependent siderophore receptor [Ideonella dechloratans]KAB0583631.1 TonB-dependent siderophore receptor [Ideonella dechloratans]UFU11146.1 TonB-dependent siderophore receptor [Ideonella dechloratans]
MQTRSRFARSAPVPVALAIALQFGPPVARAQSAAVPASAASAPVATDTTLPTVTVTGEAQGPDAPAGRRRSDSALGLDLSVRETPQSISVITRNQLDDFHLSNVNAALASATGINVEKVETDRTYYTARGFDITNFQLDGVGLPMTFGLQNGDLDTAMFERIDVIHGAAGLLTATGNPSATVNFVRKRPTAAFQASVGLTAGSWNDVRLDADVSTPLTADGRVRGRVVVAGEDSDSYLDRYHLRKGVAYGVVEADIGPSTLLTAGFSRQNNRPTGVMWGALPLNYTDGSRTNYARSTSTSPDWTYWNTDTSIGFLTLNHQFDNGWTAQLQATHKDDQQRGRMVYVYGTPDRSTGDGLSIWPSTYTDVASQNLVDARAHGAFELFGRQHQLIVGALAARAGTREQSYNGDTLGAALPEDLATWDGSLTIPSFDSDGGSSRIVDKQRSVYLAAHWRLRDDLALITGLNHTEAESTGESYGASSARKNSRLSPHVGAMWDLSPRVSAYASHTALFTPQSQQDAQRQRLAPATGTSDELGLKTDGLDKRLMATVAVFRSRQQNLASYVGVDSQGNSIYQGADFKSQGVELELMGELLPGWSVNAGYTQLAIHDEAGEPARRFTPRQRLQFNTTWQVAQLPGLKLGAQLNWRSSIHSDDVDAGEPGLLLVDLMARYQLSRQWSVSAQVNNLTDRKYLTSLYWTQSYYAAPRNYSVSLNWTY